MGAEAARESSERGGVGGSWAGKVACPSPFRATTAGLSGPPGLDVSTVHAPLFLRLLLLCCFPLRACCQPWAPPLPEAGDLAQPGRNLGSGQGASGGQRIRLPSKCLALGCGDEVIPGHHRLATSAGTFHSPSTGFFEVGGASDRAWEAGRVWRALGLLSDRRDTASLPPSLST